MYAIKHNHVINTFELSTQFKEKNMIFDTHLPVCSSSFHSMVSVFAWKYLKNSNNIIRLLTKNSSPCLFLPLVFTSP